MAVVEENLARTRGVENILLPNTFIVWQTCGDGQHSWEIGSFARRDSEERGVTRTLVTWDWTLLES